MQMDNKLLDRLYKAADNKNKIVTPKRFKKRNLDRGSDIERENQIAIKFADWFLLKNENKEASSQVEGQVAIGSTPVTDYALSIQEAPEVERDLNLVKRAEKIVK